MAEVVERVTTTAGNEYQKKTDTLGRTYYVGPDGRVSKKSWAGATSNDVEPDEPRKVDGDDSDGPTDVGGETPDEPEFFKSNVVARYDKTGIRLEVEVRSSEPISEGEIQALKRRLANQFNFNHDGVSLDTVADIDGSETTLNDRRRGTLRKPKEAEGTVSFDGREYSTELL